MDSAKETLRLQHRIHCLRRALAEAKGGQCSATPAGLQDRTRPRPSYRGRSPESPKLHGAHCFQDNSLPPKRNLLTIGIKCGAHIHLLCVCFGQKQSEKSSEMAKVHERQHKTDAHPFTTIVMNPGPGMPGHKSWSLSRPARQDSEPGMPR